MVWGRARVGWIPALPSRSKAKAGLLLRSSEDDHVLRHPRVSGDPGLCLE